MIEARAVTYHMTTIKTSLRSVLLLWLTLLWLTLLWLTLLALLKSTIISNVRACEIARKGCNNVHDSKLLRYSWVCVYERPHSDFFPFHDFLPRSGKKSLKGLAIEIILGKRTAAHSQAHAHSQIAFPIPSLYITKEQVLKYSVFKLLMLSALPFPWFRVTQSTKQMLGTYFNIG